MEWILDIVSSVVCMLVGFFFAKGWYSKKLKQRTIISFVDGISEREATRLANNLQNNKWFVVGGKVEVHRVP
jgi:hypothetical protein